jgi:TonB-dependent siderophore receptor
MMRLRAGVMKRKHGGRAARRRRGMTVVRSLATLAALLVPAAALAQTSEAARVADAAHSYSIPAGPLAAALNRFAAETRLALVYPASITQGLSTGGISGSHNPREALGILLAGSGLSYRFTGARTVTIEKPASEASDGTKVIGTVEVEGAKTAGANGSTDPTATEGTGSYTTNSMSIGSKTAQSIRETPQSVSVVTQQQMHEQNLRSVTDALQQATGVTVTTGFGGQPSFTSRGFTINSLQSDGGAPVSYGFGPTGYSPTVSLAEYDHVELIRGADGLFTGSGNPGGAVNLVRKRPLDHTQFSVEGDAGSWSNYTGSMDVTGPVPDTNGKVRSRLVVEHLDQHYFYDIAKDDHTLLYGIVEADLTPSTLLTVGTSYLRDDQVPFMTALPRYSSGADLGLPRNTCLCAPWNKLNLENTEVFARLEQHLNDDWSVKLNATGIRQSGFERYGYVSGSVNPVTQSDGFSIGTANNISRQTLADVTLNGKFTLFGRSHELVVGADWQNVDNSGATFYPTQTALPFNIFSFNPAAYAEPAMPAPSSINPVYSQNQYGAFATLRLSITDPLHVIAGVRDSGYHFDEVSNSLNKSGNVTSTYAQAYSEYNVLTPYGGIVYDLTKEWSVYGSYASIYSSQGMYLAASHAPLPPVVGASYEGGAKAELLGRKLTAQIALYYIDRTNAGLQDPNVPFSTLGGQYCCFLASGEVISRGIDAELSGRVRPDLQLTAGYTFNDNFTKVGAASAVGQPVATLQPKHLFKLWATYQLPGALSPWTLGFGANAQSATYAVGTAYTAFNPDGTGKGSMVPYNIRQNGYAVFNARVAYQIDKNWSAALNVNNIFDRVYYQTIGTTTSLNWYGPPRNAMLTLRGVW